MTVEEALLSYYAEKQEVVLHPLRIACAMKVLIPILGDLACNELRRDHCRQYTKKRCDLAGVKPSTVHKELTILKTAINFAHPTATAIFEFPLAGKPRDKYLTKEQCQITKHPIGLGLGLFLISCGIRLPRN